MCKPKGDQDHSALLVVYQSPCSVLPAVTLLCTPTTLLGCSFVRWVRSAAGARKVILRAHFFDLLTVKIWCRIITQVPAVGTKEWWMPGRRKQLPWSTHCLSSLCALKVSPGACSSPAPTALPPPLFLLRIEGSSLWCRRPPSLLPAQLRIACRSPEMCLFIQMRNAPEGSIPDSGSSS